MTPKDFRFQHVPLILPSSCPYNAAQPPMSSFEVGSSYTKPTSELGKFSVGIRIAIQTANESARKKI